MASAPLDPAGPPDLRNVRIDVLRDAVNVYMGLAYPDTDPPESVRKRLLWDGASDAAELLSRPPFECAGRDRGTGATIYALRLGNACYPHMKLQIQPWPNAAGFLLSVNTHDQIVALDANTEGLDRFRAIQEGNQRLKEAIEQAWDDAQLPTFLRYLRNYIDERARK